MDVVKETMAGCWAENPESRFDDDDYYCEYDEYDDGCCQRDNGVLLGSESGVKVGNAYDDDDNMR